MWWLIAAIIIGAIISGAVKGVTAYKEGDRGWNLFGSILGGAIMGAGMGGLLAFGGGVAIGAVAGVTLTSAVIIGAAVGIGAGALSYTTESLIRDDRQWNYKEFIRNGLSGLVKGMLTVSIGYASGMFFGSYDKLLLKPVLKGSKFYSETYKISKVIMGRKLFLSPLSEFLIKSSIGGAAALLRMIIDYILDT